MASNMLVINPVEDDKLYTRADASRVMDIHVTTFDKHFRDSDFIQKYGIEKIGHMKLYKGRELNIVLDELSKSAGYIVIGERDK